MKRVRCLDCERYIDLTTTLQVGEKFSCPYCKTKLEVVNLDPIELDWAYENSQIDWDRLFDEVWS